VTEAKIDARNKFYPYPGANLQNVLNAFPTASNEMAIVRLQRIVQNATIDTMYHHTFLSTKGKSTEIAFAVLPRL